MKHQYNDGGRGRYTNVASTHDCVVRAVAIAANIPYIDAYAKLRSISPDLDSAGVNVGSVAFKSYMNSLGFVRVDGVTAMQDIPEGRVIACTSGHYTAIINGVIQDTRNEAHKVVSHYWVWGTAFAVYHAGKMINSGILNRSQATTMARLYYRNYRKHVHLKSVR